jgi:hypothetical protein
MNQPHHDELERFRSEAAALLGVNDPAAKGRKPRKAAASLK